MALVETLTVASLARLLQPIIKDIYGLALKAGVGGLRRWDASSIPKTLAAQIKSIDQVRTIWKPDGSISLQEFFHPPKILIDRTPARVSRISDLPSNAIVIEGIVGQGKSVFLRSLAIQELTTNDGKWLPMLLELKDLSTNFGLNEALLKKLESYNVDGDQDTLDYLLGSGKFALLLDGFDELEEAVVKPTQIAIDHLSRKYPGLRIVVTCRPGHEIQKSTTFKTISIAGITQPEYAAFLEKLQVDTKKSQDLRQAIKDSPTKISDLLTTPLMLTLVVLVYESESKIPDSLPDFFESLFHTVFTKHDRQKANFNRKHKCGLSEKSLQKLFETFCFMTLQRGYGRTLTGNQFGEILELARDREKFTCEIEDFRHDITKSACLMLEDGFDSITYLHKSILEYFSAAFVRRLSDENAERYYNYALTKPSNWREVLFFLRSIDPIRHAKYFTLPVVRINKTEILLPCAEASEKELIKRIAEIFKDLTVEYIRNEGDKVYSLGLVSSEAYRVRDEIGDLSHIVMNTIYEHVPKSPENLIEEFGPLDLPSSPEVRASISSFAAFSYLGAINIRRMLGIYEARILKAEERAIALVKTEEKDRELLKFV